MVSIPAAVSIASTDQRFLSWLHRMTSREAIRKKTQSVLSKVIFFTTDKETFFRISLPFGKIKWWEGALLCLLALIRKNKSTATICLSSVYTCVVAPCRLYFHACLHISLSPRSLREIRYFRSSVRPMQGNPDSRIREICAVVSGILCFGIPKTAQQSQQSQQSPIRGRSAQRSKPLPF